MTNPVSSAVNSPNIFQRARPATLAFLWASAICLLLLGIRAVVAGEMRWTFFPWNLLLAWVPFGLALVACHLLERGSRGVLLWTVCVLWFLFFPNAFYIVTDFVHLRSRPEVPRWLDYTFITAYACTGLALGHVSLALLHRRVRAWLGLWPGRVFVAAMLAAGSFGIYVGRFLRWNSWDVFTRPWVPLRDLAHFADKEALLQVCGFCGVFFLFSLLVCAIFHGVSRGADA